MISRYSLRSPFPIILGGVVTLYLLFTYLAPNTSSGWLPILGRADHIPRILLVTAYFPLAKSKHSQAEYDHWLTNLMGQLSTDMYIFTTSSYESHLQELIAKAVNSDLTLSRNHSAVFAQRKVYYDTRYARPLDTPPLAAFASVANEQWEKDPEKSYHNPDLYAVWDSKAYFVGEAVRAMAEARAYDSTVPKYKYVFWEDAGAMRADHLLQAWPDMARLDTVFGEATKKLDPESVDSAYPLILFPFWREPYGHEKAPNVAEEAGPIRADISEGSFFGGTPSSVLWFERTFYGMLDRLLAKDFFVGKDQTVFNLVMALNPSHFFGPIPSSHTDLANWGAGPCGDTWFYYHQWLASSAERAETEAWRSGTKCPLVPLDFPFL